MSSVSHALVTGGAGFIGSHLAHALIASGRRVTVLDNLSVGRREAVPDGARFVHGDLRHPNAVADALAGVDAVFHLAAQVTIRGRFDRFYEDLDTNVMGTARLPPACVRPRPPRTPAAAPLPVRRRPPRSCRPPSPRPPPPPRRSRPPRPPPLRPARRREPRRGGARAPRAGGARAEEPPASPPSSS